MLSSDVQVPLPTEASEESSRLSQQEIRTLVIELVPGADNMLYRDFEGQYALDFLATAYANGIRAFEGTHMKNHLLWSLRLIVHYGDDRKPGAARYLRELVEAFMDCQAVQARVVERLALEIRGLTADFHGLVVRLLGDYKRTAITMLAFDRIAQHMASDDGNPTHYENRLTADLGSLLGLNQDDIRRAQLDEHAASRFSCLSPADSLQAAQRCRELFDGEAFLCALQAEVNSFSENSPNESIPKEFLKWAGRRLRNKHIVFDEETCSQVDVGRSLMMAIVEVLFLGSPTGSETYRGTSLQELFLPDEI